MTLLQECINQLGEDCKVYDKQMSNEMFDDFQRMFSFTKLGRIEWELIRNKVIVQNENDILRNFKGSDCIIFWDEGTLPVIKTTIKSVLHALNDIRAVSFDTWIVNFANKCVLEFYHEGDIIIGFQN